MAARFNPAPGWPVPPEGWTPPEGWQPDPTWPPAPEGWQFWVEDDLAAGAAPATAAMPAVPPAPPAPGAPVGGPQPGGPGSVPPAQYATYQQGSGEPPTKKNNLVWIIPVAVILLLGVVFGALALSGVFGDDDEPTAATTRTAAPTPSAEPTTPEPSATPSQEASPEASPEAPTDLPTASDDPLAPAFCAANNSVAQKSGQAIVAETAGEYVEHMSTVLETMETMVAPAEIAEAWAYNLEYTRDSLEYIAGLDPATPNFEAQVQYMTEVGVDQIELSDVASQIQSFVLANCL